MLRRLQKLSKNEDLFLFGPRGSGKSTLVSEIFGENKVLSIDLLTEADEDAYGRSPDNLKHHLASHTYDYVIIDEVQKFPKLLDVVHHLIEKTKGPRPFFILTGSSSRKLKRQGANLLAGRAFLYSLFPFSSFELAERFNLNDVLTFGSLPPVVMKNDSEKKADFLRSYVKTYLREEILMEQAVRQIDPFSAFLEVAAQMNGCLINHSKIARDVKVSDQTVKSYFQILEDTLLGFSLQPFHRSIRRRQSNAAKFYFFDCGVKRALERKLKLSLEPETFEYGKAFEHWLILEFIFLNEYFKTDFRFSYLRTKDDAEIDLIVERPGESDLLIEIKSSKKVQEEDVTTLNRFCTDWDRPAESMLLSRDFLSKKIGNTRCLYWQEALKEIFFKQ